MNAATVDPGIPLAWQRDVESREKGEAWKKPLLLNGRGDPEDVRLQRVRRPPAPPGSRRSATFQRARPTPSSALPYPGRRARAGGAGPTPTTRCCRTGASTKGSWSGPSSAPRPCRRTPTSTATTRYGPTSTRSGWDGVRRLDRWLETYLGATVEPGREEYLRQISRKSPIQCVARICDRGARPTTCSVLQGGQGVGKSTAIRILAPREEWFADEIADLGSKDSAQDLAGKWIIEVPELARSAGARSSA